VIEVFRTIDLQLTALMVSLMDRSIHSLCCRVYIGIVKELVHETFDVNTSFWEVVNHCYVKPILLPNPS